MSTRELLMQEVDKLSTEQLERLLDLARRIQRVSLPTGTPGSVLVKHMDKFQFEPGAVDEMMRIIEEDY